jgi:N-acyl-L-homoserine lactone synthetase
MALVIRPQHRRHFPRILDEIFQLRRRVFVDRLGWSVPDDGGLREFDKFDFGACLHLAVLADGGRVVGTMRLTPSSEPNVTCDVLAGKIGHPIPRGDHLLEASRFCVDLNLPRDARAAALNDLWLSQFELYRKHGWTHVVTVTYARTIQPFVRAGGRIDVIGSPFVFPGDKEPSFAMIVSGGTDATIERISGRVSGALLDPDDDPSLIDLYGGQRAA